MDWIHKLLLAVVPIVTLSACGGGDETPQAAGTFDPQVRFANVSPTAPALTLARNDVNRPEATGVSNIFLSDYFTVDTGNADYRVSGKANPASTDFAFAQTIPIDAGRGHRYTILAVTDALPPGGGSLASANTLVVVDDPTNPDQVDDQAHVRAVNGSFNAQNVDIYLIGLNETIDTRAPDLPSIAFKQSKPASGSESARRRGGDYQVVATTAGTKNILYRGRFTVPGMRDVLFVTVPYIAGTPGAGSSGVGIVAKVQGDGGRGALIPSL